MDLGDLISPQAVLSSIKCQSKKQVLLRMCACAQDITGIDKRDVFEVVMQRERLGSTGIGNGLAIPHGKLDALDRIVVVFARLEQPVDFEAIDDEPVDLVFLLLAPAGAGADHLKALSRISRLMREPAAAARLRQCITDDALFAVLSEPKASNAA